MAQDFKEAFYPGRDQTWITTLEFDGVALAAIKGLSEKIEKQKTNLEGQLNRITSENAQLTKEVLALKAVVFELKDKLNTVQETTDAMPTPASKPLAGP
jgi:hypothetical protein